MANEILAVYTTGATLTFGVYYDNSGTLTEREAGTSMTEEPASSGLYKGSPSTIENGDVVIVKESTTIVGSAEYQPEVDAVLVLGATPISTADINAECDTALSDIGLDHLVAVADADDVVDNSIIAHIAASDGDWSGFDDATDSLEAIKDNQDTIRGADSDTLETLSDQIDAVPTVGGQPSMDD